jgi:DNA-binding protein H-NS
MPARESRDKPVKRRAKRGAARVASSKLPDLSALSEEELSAMVGLIEQEIAGRRQQQRKDFFATIRVQAQQLGVAPEELAAELARKPARALADGRTGPTRTPKGNDGAMDRRLTVAPKYRNPNNPAETWAGRGVKPRWMQALLAQGQHMEDFRIES